MTAGRRKRDPYPAARIGARAGDTRLYAGSGLPFVYGNQGHGIQQKRTDLEQEATQNWNYFVAIHMASLLVLILLFIPTLFIAVTIAIFIAAILLMLRFMCFMKTCGEELQGEA